MSFEEWLKKAIKYRKEGLLPELKLKDGTNLSVQASMFHMCYPQEKFDDEKYKQVEGHTHEEEVDGFDKCYVIIEQMEKICQLHGGIISEF